MKAMFIEGLCDNGTWVQLYRAELLNDVALSIAEQAMEELSDKLRTLTQPIGFSSDGKSVSFNPTRFLAVRVSLAGFKA